MEIDKIKKRIIEEEQQNKSNPKEIQVKVNKKVNERKRAIEKMNKFRVYLFL